MEGGEGAPQISKLSKFLENARRLFGKKVSGSSEIQDNVHPATEPQPDWETISKAFATAEKLVKSGDKSKLGGFTLPVDKRGGIETKAMLELMTVQEKMELADATVGDVAWWTDERGRSGYFLVTKPYKSSPSFEYGSGVIKAELDNETVEGEAVITGASFGGMLMMGRIVKNVPVEFVVEGENSARYWTHLVETMGIIKAETINKTT